MKLPQPRPYQEKGMALMRRAYADGKRKILFWLATGGGKSIIFLMLFSGLLNNKKKVLFLVKRKQLVFQTQKHLQKSGIDCSILIADNPGFDKTKPVQICSIDTVVRRDMEFLKGFDVVIIDEAHDATSPSYQEFLKDCEEEYGIKTFFGLTATPFAVNGKNHLFWDAIIKPIEMHELRDQGFLVDAHLYVPADIDLSGVKTSRLTGDYNEKQLSQKMQDLEVIGDAVNLYKVHGEGKPGLCFCVDVEHSKRMAIEFQRAGIPAAHCDQGTKQKERDQAIKDLQDGKIKVLCNVNIFSTGVDIPQAEIGIMARPTQSECLYIQQAGRLLRPYRLCGKCNSQYDNSPLCPVCGFDKPSYIKERAVILDMGNNTSRFGRVFDVRYADVDEKIKDKSEAKPRPLIKTCKKCFMVYEATAAYCPACGDTATKERFYKTKDGELRPYNEFEIMQSEFTHLQRVTLEKNLKPNWKFFKLYEKFGDAVMKYQKEFGIPAWVPKIYKKSQEEKLNGKLYT